MANFLEAYGIKPKMTSDLSDKKPINLFDFSNIKKPSELMAQQTKPTQQSGFSNMPKTNQIRYNDIDLENAQKLKDLGVSQDKIIELVNKKKQQREGVQEQPKDINDLGLLEESRQRGALAGQSIKGRIGEVAESWQRPTTGNAAQRAIQPLGTALKTAGSTIGAGWDIAGQGLAYITPDGVKNKLSDTGKAIWDKTPELVKQSAVIAIQEGGEAYKQFKQEYPFLADAFEGTGNIASIVPIGKGTQAGTKVLKQGGDKLVDTGKVVLQKTGDILPDRQKIAQNISTKANRFNAVDEEKFIKEIGETPGEFAVTRGMSDVGEPAVEKATKNYLDSVKQADDAFEQIGGNYKYTGKGNDPIKISLDDLEKRYINTENDNLGRIQELKQKYDTDGLTFTEINELKRDYSRNFKYGFEDRNSEALARSSNIQNKLREWQFEKASEMGLENIRDINKNTKAWKMYADSLEKKINRSSANNAVSITDWIALSGGNVSNLALFLGKKVGTSDKAKQLLIKTLGKTTKSPIIKPNVNKPQIKGLLGQGPIITPAPKGKSNIKVTPSTIQPNVNRGLLALPEGKKPTIITPQTAEKGIIQESKKGLEKTKMGIMNSSDVADNTRIVKDTIDSINDVKQLENLKSEIKELGLPRERELLSELQIKIDGIKELIGLDNIGTTLYKEYGDDLINDFKVLFKNEIRNKTTKGADKYSKVEFNTTPAFKNFKNSVDDYLSQNPWIDKSTQEIYDELKEQLTNTKIKDIKKPVLLKGKTNGTNNTLPSNRNNSVMATKLKPANKTYITQEKARELKLGLFANDRILLNKKLNRLNIDTPIEEIEKIGKILTSDAQKLAKIKVVIREHLKNKTSKKDLIEKIENILKKD